MRPIALLAGAALLWGIASPAFALERPPSDEVAVTFKEPVGDRFVGVLNLVMGTETAHRTNATHYLFRIGDRGNQNDYAVFFASLPYVQTVSPLPRLSAADREMPNVVIGYGVGASPAPGASAAPNPTTTGAGGNRLITVPPGSSTPAMPPNNGGAGLYLSPNQLIGAHVLVRYRAEGPVPELINQVYGTRTIDETEADQSRLLPPPHVSPQVESRVLRLCPYITQAEPAYGR